MRGSLGIPSSARAVGTTSASTPPPSLSSRPATVTISGTGFVEWAVSGLPSGASIWSALPWSAVTIRPPPPPWTASTTNARQRSTASTARVAAAMSPVWPTMSAFAKLIRPNRNGSPAAAPSRQRATNSVAASRALISGLWS